MTGLQGRTSLAIVNPLPLTLHHYCNELLDVLDSSSGGAQVVESSAIEGHRSFAKARVTISLLLERVRMRRPGSKTIVIWPAFGYFDAVTWLPLSLSSQVTLIVHDVMPLRKQFGYSSFARAVFRIATRWGKMRVLCHTPEAAAELKLVAAVNARVVSHPIFSPGNEALLRGNAVRVMGQFKEARAIEPLLAIADRGVSDCTLEIYGRGWPPVQGWEVRDEFLPEREFDELLRTASCIVLPYQRFYQSNVAIRAIESQVPIVAVRHSQLIDLFGDQHPGFVEDGDWAAAVARAVSMDPSTLHLQSANARERAVREWREALR